MIRGIKKEISGPLGNAELPSTLVLTFACTLSCHRAPFKEFAGKLVLADIGLDFGSTTFAKKLVLRGEGFEARLRNFNAVP